MEYLVASLEKEAVAMVTWAVIFFVLSLFAAVLGFGGLAGVAAGIATILFYIFFVLFVVALLVGVGRNQRTPTPEPR